MLYRDQRGSVLWFVLAFINVIALLMVVSFEMIELEPKLSINYVKVIEQQMISFSVMQTIYQKFLRQAAVDCLDLPNVFISPIQADDEWWHTATGICRDFFQNQNIQYLFEELEESPCETLDGVHSVLFWRATIRLEDRINPIAPYFVQANFAGSTKKLLSACRDSVKVLDEPFQAIYFPRG